MRGSALAAAAAAAVLALAAGPAWSQAHPSATGSAEQRAAIDALDFLNGEWRGEAIAYGPDGEQVVLTQTERVGDLLGGWVKLVEGRGYDADGNTAFNALAVISWDEAEGRYRFRTWANGRGGDFRFERTDTGFRWEVPAGPGAVVRYTATVADGVWHEVGDYIREGAEPVRTVEMTLRRIGDSDWPGAVSPR